MRVTSALWVAALVRRTFAAGGAAAVVRRGAEEAGAIFVIVDRLDGTSDLYAPAPQSEFREGVDDRLFQRLKQGEAGEAIATAIARETRFDPDIWVVAVEDRAGRAFIETIG